MSKYRWQLKAAVAERLRIMDELEHAETRAMIERDGDRIRGHCDLCQSSRGLKVDRDKNTFRCFSCGVFGDALTYQLGKIGKLDASGKPYEGADMELAIELAPRLGIKLEEYEYSRPLSERERQARENAQQKEEAFNLLAQCFHELLMAQPDDSRYDANVRQKAKQAREYLIGRGITEEEMRRSKLGFCPKFFKGLDELFKKHRIGLAASNYFVSAESGICKLHNRVIVPYFRRGKCIKLTGRTLAPKDEVEKFDINKYLYFVLDAGVPPVYCLDDAERHEIVWGWESELDSNLLRSYGAMNVASFGGIKNFSKPVHVERFRNTRIKTVVLCPDQDPDFRGQAAAIQMGLLLMRAGITVRICILTSETGEKEDVGSFITKYGIDRFARLPQTPGCFLSLEQYMLRVALDQWYARLAKQGEKFSPSTYVESPFEIARVLQPLMAEVIPVFKTTGTLTLGGQMLIQELSNELGLPSETVERCIRAAAQAEDDIL